MCLNKQKLSHAKAHVHVAAAFNQEKSLYVDAKQPLGRFLPQLHSIAEGETSGLRDACGALMPPCIIMEKGEALDVWIQNSGDKIGLFAGLEVRVVLARPVLALSCFDREDVTKRRSSWACF